MRKSIAYKNALNQYGVMLEIQDDLGSCVLITDNDLNFLHSMQMQEININVKNKIVKFQLFLNYNHIESIIIHSNVDSFNFLLHFPQIRQITISVDEDQTEEALAIFKLLIENTLQYINIISKTINIEPFANNLLEGMKSSKFFWINNMKYSTTG